MQRIAGWNVAMAMAAGSILFVPLSSADDGAAATAADQGAQVVAAEGSVRVESREKDYATKELKKAVVPLLIPRDRRPVTGMAAGGSGVGGLPDTDRIRHLMYEGMDLVQDEEYAKAIPLLEAVLDADPTIIAVWTTLGWTYWQVGRQADAVMLWKRLLELDPAHPASHLLMGNAYVGTGRLREAEVHLKRSIELDSHQIEPQLVLGTVYRWTGRHQASVDSLRKLLSEHPDRMDIQNQLGLSLYENGNYDEALPLLEQGVRALPDDLELARVHARCLLRTGNLTQAQLQARRMLRDQDSDLELLLLLADAPRYSNDPGGALPYLRKIIETAKEQPILIEAHLRLIEISTRLWESDPRRYTLEEAIGSAKALLEIDEKNPSWRQSYGNLLLSNQQYTAAGQQFQRILDDSTTNVLSARIGMFEVGQAANAYSLGKENFDFVASINPANPYLYQMLSRLELSRGNVTEAHAALDRLEAAGARGAVAVLHYSALSDSDWAESMSVRRFRLQMLALKQAGYRFLVPSQIAAYFAEFERKPSDIDDVVPQRAVVVTFDQPDARTLKLATEVASDLDLVFAVHVAAGPVDAGLAGIPGVETLREYAATGRWVFGSMLYDAVTPVPVRPDERLGSLLANRVWIAKDEMYETDLDFSRRLRREYRFSRQRLREWLGETQPVGFVAYPYGEFGQGLLSNVDDAIAQNLYEASVNYEVGFIPSVFGYAVNGDNPLMYQRYSPGAFDSGEDLLDHLAMHHPVFLARRMRAELAALDGRLSKSRHCLELLRRDGYPERPYERIEAFVYQHLALKFGLVRQTAKSDKGMFNLEIEHPYGGGQFEWFKDSLERRNWGTAWHAGLYVTPVINAEARAGYGEFEQRYTLNLAGPDDTPILQQRRADVTEKFIGGRVGMRIESKKPASSPITINTGLERHEYRGDADFDDWAYMVESAFRPVLYYDVLLRVDHDGMPSARSLTEGLTYDQYSYAGALRVRDWWDLWTRASYYDIADGNERLHLDASTMWELSESAGLLAGFEYGYVDAKHPKIDYWTPYRLNQGFLVGQVRNNFYRFYYDVALKFGYAKEDIRLGDQLAYERLVVRAKLFKFDPGEGPKSEWVQVFSANAALRMNLGRYLQGYWEGLYNESVNYHEFKTIAGLSLMF